MGGAGRRGPDQVVHSDWAPGRHCSGNDTDTGSEGRRRRESGDGSQDSLTQVPVDAILAVSLSERVCS